LASVSVLVFVKIKSFTVAPKSPKDPAPMKTIGADIRIGVSSRSTVVAIAALSCCKLLAPHTWAHLDEVRK